MFGLDDHIAALSHGGSILIVLLVAILLGLRHAGLGCVGVAERYVRRVVEITGPGRSAAGRGVAYGRARWPVVAAGRSPPMGVALAHPADSGASNASIAGMSGAVSPLVQYSM